MDRASGFDWNFGLAIYLLNKLLNFLSLYFLNWKSIVITYATVLIWGLSGMIYMNTWYRSGTINSVYYDFEEAIFILF